MIPKMFKVNFVGWLILVIILVIVRSLLAEFIDRCASNSIEYKGYSKSVDKDIFKCTSMLAYLFTILLGLLPGAIVSFLYACSLSKKE